MPKPGSTRLVHGSYLSGDLYSSVAVGLGIAFEDEQPRAHVAVVPCCMLLAQVIIERGSWFVCRGVLRIENVENAVCSYRMGVHGETRGDWSLVRKVSRNMIRMKTASLVHEQTPKIVVEHTISTHVSPSLSPGLALCHQRLDLPG